jgi:predicted ester cyclase
MIGTRELNKRVVAGFFDAVNNRDPEELREFVSEDVMDYNHIIYGEEGGPGAPFRGIEQQLAAFNPFEIRVAEMFASRNKVVARTTMTGTHSGRHPRMPEPTFHHFMVEAIWMFTLERRKITAIRGVSDRLGMFLQLGWKIPPEEPSL